MDWVSGAFFQAKQTLLPSPFDRQSFCTARAHTAGPKVSKLKKKKPKLNKNLPTNQQKTKPNWKPANSWQQQFWFLFLFWEGKKKKRHSEALFNWGIGETLNIVKLTKKVTEVYNYTPRCSGEGRAPCCALPQKERGEPCFPLLLSLGWSALWGRKTYI